MSCSSARKCGPDGRLRRPGNRKRKGAAEAAPSLVVGRCWTSGREHRDDLQRAPDRRSRSPRRPGSTRSRATTAGSRRSCSGPATSLHRCAEPRCRRSAGSPPARRAARCDPPTMTWWIFVRCSELRLTDTLVALLVVLPAAPRFSSCRCRSLVDVGARSPVGLARVGFGRVGPGRVATWSIGLAPFATLVGSEPDRWSRSCSYWPA